YFPGERHFHAGALPRSLILSPLQYRFQQFGRCTARCELTSSADLSRRIPTRSHLCGRRTELRFTVLRPASAEVSPCCHRPSGGDVACGVDVGIARARSAGDALENRLALAVFRRDMPAPRASLRRIRCRDEFEPSLSLVLEPGHQQSPALP